MSLILKSSLELPEQAGAANVALTNKEREEIAKLQAMYLQMKQQLRQKIVGLEEVIEQIMIAILSGGHSLLIGVPGLAKTLTIRCVAELMDLKFSRIQFTPDLMPSDITGTEILMQDETQQVREFNFLKGPVFANLILADEINRTPPKTQSALLEAMEEHTVTSMGRRFELEPPFFVLATQNPIEQEGTYPLPVAQLDRFMFNLILDYPSWEDEYRIMRVTISQSPRSLNQLFSQEQILRLLAIVRKIEISTAMMEYAISLCRASRPTEGMPVEFIRTYVSWGVSPRAAQWLIIGGKARAMLMGREQVTSEDIQAIIHPVMRHRLLMSYQADVDLVTPEAVVDFLLATVPTPEGNVIQAPKTSRTQFNPMLSIKQISA